MSPVFPNCESRIFPCTRFRVSTRLILRPDDKLEYKSQETQQTRSESISHTLELRSNDGEVAMELSCPYLWSGRGFRALLMRAHQVSLRSASGLIVNRPIHRRDVYIFIRGSWSDSMRT